MVLPSRPPDPLGEGPSGGRFDEEPDEHPTRGSGAGWQPRPNDFLVEPMFAPFEGGPGTQDIQGEQESGDGNTEPFREAQRPVAQVRKVAWWRTLWQQLRQRLR